MKKFFSFYFLSVALFVGLVCSCSTGPNYGKLIPKDAAVVMSFNVEKAIESSGLEGEDEPKEALEKLMKGFDFSRATREKLEEVIDDPDEAGLDLREPLMLFYSPSYKNEAGITGAVYDAQKLEDLINTMAREALCNKVNTYGELRYTVMNKTVLAFNDSWFFITERKSSQINDDAVLDEIEGLFMQDEEKSLYGTDIYEKMSDSEGFFQMLLQGDGLKDMMNKYPDFQKYMASIPQNVALSDYAYLCDLSLKKGEILLTGETVLLTDEAKEWMEKNSPYGEIAGDFDAYIPSDVLFQISTNINGEKILQQLEENQNISMMLGEEKMKYLKPILAGIKGDCTLFVEDIIRHTGFPEMSIYVQAENADWLNTILPDLPLKPEKVAENEYALPLYENYEDEQNAANQNVAPDAYAKFGMRGGVGYVLIGKSPDPFYKAKSIEHLGDGRQVYMRLNIDDLVDMGIFKDAFGRMEGMVVKQVVEPFDYAEVYTENQTKTIYRIVMKNKEESPVKVVYDQVFKFVKNFL